jgi:predicted nucleic acid-binding protein
MKYVLDSSVAFKWAIVENHTTEARALRDRFVGGHLELLAPDVFAIELGHALTKAQRQGRITAAEGRQFFADLLTTAPALIPSMPLLPRAYAIAAQMRIGIYDCLYVALAEREQCTFVTADERLIRALQADYPLVVGLTAVP